MCGELEILFSPPKGTMAVGGWLSGEGSHLFLLLLQSKACHGIYNGWVLAIR